MFVKLCMINSFDLIQLFRLHRQKWFEMEKNETNARMNQPAPWIKRSQRPPVQQCLHCGKTDAIFTDGRKHKCDDCRRTKQCKMCGKLFKETDMHPLFRMCLWCEVSDGFWDMEPVSITD